MLRSSSFFRSFITRTFFAFSFRILLSLLLLRLRRFLGIRLITFLDAIDGIIEYVRRLDVYDFEVLQAVACIEVHSLVALYCRQTPWPPVVPKHCH